MQTVQLVGMTPEENNKPIFEYIDKKFDDLKKFYQPKEPEKYLTRAEVSKMLSVDVSTIHNLTKRNILEKYQIGGRCLYLRSQVEKSIVKINN
jgi:hypothetical protein